MSLCDLNTEIRVVCVLLFHNSTITCLRRFMEVTADDPALAIRFKIEFFNDLDTSLGNMSMLWFKLNTHNLLLNSDPDSKFLTLFSELLPKKRRFCDMRSSDDDSRRTRIRDGVDINEWLLQWLNERKGSFPGLALIARKQL
ncbi:hypothetical protein RF11_06430 [Thelohanellus kitauei]|uniref:Uncharacterized protein n=1 Tax=Thelohanellus kitauei TaxID=669202 RepID=A0A0C2JT65_THEKT|nr:hypothetical protein RF11_06430 [Thelohanellus kitauei]